MVWRADTTVYGLASNRDGRIRYVGQTCRSPEKRHRKHLENARLGVQTHLYNWIRAEMAAGYEVFFFVIESRAVYNDAERRIISRYRQHGASLVNQTDGGDGTLGWKHTPTSRKKMLEKRVGQKQRLSPKEIQRRRDHMARVIADPAVRAKLSRSLTGRKLSAEAIAKRTATRRAKGNYRNTPEQKAARSKRMKEWWQQRKAAAQ